MPYRRVRAHRVSPLALDYASRATASVRDRLAGIAACQGRGLVRRDRDSRSNARDGREPSSSAPCLPRRWTCGFDPFDPLVACVASSGWRPWWVRCAACRSPGCVHVGSAFNRPGGGPESVRPSEPNLATDSSANARANISSARGDPSPDPSNEEVFPRSPRAPASAASVERTRGHDDSRSEHDGPSRTR